METEKIDFTKDSEYIRMFGKKDEPVSPPEDKPDVLAYFKGVIE